MQEVEDDMCTDSAKGLFSSLITVDVDEVLMEVLKYWDAEAISMSAMTKNVICYFLTRITGETILIGGDKVLKSNRILDAKDTANKLMGVSSTEVSTKIKGSKVQKKYMLTSCGLAAPTPADVKNKSIMDYNNTVNAKCISFTNYKSLLTWYFSVRGNKFTNDVFNRAHLRLVSKQDDFEDTDEDWKIRDLYITSALIAGEIFVWDYPFKVENKFFKTIVDKLKLSSNDFKPK